MGGFFPTGISFIVCLCKGKGDAVMGVDRGIAGPNNPTLGLKNMINDEKD